MNDLHTRNGGHRVRPGASVRIAHPEPEVDDAVLVTPGEIAAWTVVMSLLAFMAVVFAAIAAFHLIASIY